MDVLKKGVVMDMRCVMHSCLILGGLLQGSLWAVRFVNVTEAPVYFAVYYRKTPSQAIRYSGPAEGFYTASPGGQAFLTETGQSGLPAVDFKWPAQLCSGWGFFGDCREHHPRTVFFSFEKQDILAGEVDVKNPQGLASTVYLGKNIGSALYQGWNVEGGKTYMIFYNPFGFDPQYASNEKLNSDIKGAKLNASLADDKAVDALRRYLAFAQYTFFE